jgi:2-phospho-L-lactate guanylyltransferase
VSLRIIVPHRGLADSKTRLSPVLDDEERERLAERLLRRVLAVVTEVAPVVVITPAEELGALVEGAGERLEVQHGLGLNAGLDQARRAALADGVTELVVLHGDLPLLETDDVRALIAAIPQPEGVAIGPDRFGTGTNALALRPPEAIPFHFGVRSFPAHLEAAQEAGVEVSVVERPGLAFDLDTPGDLARWLELGHVA